ncbi:unnamed protein product, partial [Chrysoparadoxa australica]
KVPPSPPKGRPMEMDEIAALINSADYHLQAFIIMMIATAARNKAVLDLTFDQIDFANGLIDLNPQGREQTHKYRPKVRLPANIKLWLETAQVLFDCDSVVQYKGAPVASIRTGWRTLRDRLDLDGDVQPYGIRHTMARWLRMSGVPPWEAAAQLGHKMPGLSTTEIYAPFDPSYLEKAVQAIDTFMDELACEMR